MTQQGAGWSQTQETASALEGTLTAGRGASLTLAEGADCAPGLVSPPCIPAAVEGDLGLNPGRSRQRGPGV